VDCLRADLDVLLNDALSRVSLDSSVRVEVCRHESLVAATTPVGATVPAVDKGQWLSWPAYIVAYMTRLANLGTAP
jgi:hypothetical protein